MKIIIAALTLAFVLTACPSKPKEQTPPVITPPTTTLPPVVVVPPSEPASHQKPFFTDDEGLKRGGVRLIGERYKVMAVANNFSPKPPPAPTCEAKPVVGADCENGFNACDIGTIRYQCESKKTYVVFGWVSEKDLTTGKYTPKAGVKFDIFMFAGCLQGNCKPSAGPVMSDEFGYFEMETTWLQDTLRMYAPEGFYGNVCSNGKVTPPPSGGSYLPQPGSNFIGQSFKVIKITENSCK